MNKELLGIIFTIVVFIVGAVAYIMYPWIGIEMHTRRLPDPPMPAITYGEFPFRLIYELNGEQIVIEDVIIAEFAGVRRAGGSATRIWTRRLASGNSILTLLEIDDVYAIGINPGRSAAFYMGDPYMSNVRLTFPSDETVNPTFIFNMKDGSMSTSIISESELFEIHGIRIISWEPSPPIVNSFE